MYNLIISICWFIFFSVWFFFSRTAKKTLDDTNPDDRALTRLIMAIAVIRFLTIHFTYRPLADYPVFPRTPVFQSIGCVMCAAGVAFAIWARTHLGRNWGMPMSVKEKPDLITTGPYRRIRHPIYTGILLAMFSCLVTAGFMWLIWLLLYGGYFLYSAKKEENRMVQLFPDEYGEYRKQTGMFLPFVGYIFLFVSYASSQTDS
ncbi:methyltransferase family protein [Larkinella rosea]|uniref:Isoprenylcysteine carboxylmethyltransferase family protein n=1 Tax=Larkinella rosea TaxID=2025312 RepID=A0A3P1BZ33_9BACT|nr:isoprenylcysteine carboxylmethyltransferase family protein [Larkinella rosea]RRB06317.1 isoprenylcysteine carboxylmethyltransferase family protein [Larkinella rosea]